MPCRKQGNILLVKARSAYVPHVSLMLLVLNHYENQSPSSPRLLWVGRYGKNVMVSRRSKNLLLLLWFKHICFCSIKGFPATMPLYFCYGPEMIQYRVRERPSTLQSRLAERTLAQPTPFMGKEYHVASW